MNEEEGELRPQIADRHRARGRGRGARGRRSARAEVIRRREAFTRRSRPRSRPAWADAQAELAERVAAARERARRRFALPERSTRRSRRLVVGSGVDEPPRRHHDRRVREGARRARRARRGRARTTCSTAAELALGHRLARRPVRAGAAGRAAGAPAPARRRARSRGDPKKSGGPGEVGPELESRPDGASRPSRASRSTRPRCSAATAAATGSSAARLGRRARSLVGLRRGKYTRHRLARPGDRDVAFDATLRAAAVRGGAGRRSRSRPEDLRRQGPRASLAVQRLLRRRQQLVGARRADGREGEGRRLRAARGRDARAATRSRSSPSRAACPEATVALPPTASLALARRRLRGDPAERADAARRRAAPGPAAPARRAASGTRTPVPLVVVRQRRAADRAAAARAAIRSPTCSRRRGRCAGRGSAASSPRCRRPQKDTRLRSPSPPAARDCRWPRLAAGLLVDAVEATA